MILGAIAGDVVGSVYEFHNVKREDFELFGRDSRYTDDTVMTLAVADALMEALEGRRPISDALVTSMRALGRAHINAGYGGRFIEWLLGDEKDAKPYDSWGNGSAMRVSAAAWVCDTLEAVEHVAAQTAEVTHNHPEGIRGAQATATCALLARQGATNDDIRQMVRGRYGYALDLTLKQIRPTYTFDVSCQGSVPQAIEAFLEADGFEDCVRKAVSIGGDSDTIAAIAASIAQGRYGVPADIEHEVRTRLAPDLLQINDRFCATYVAADVTQGLNAPTR